ncbi:6960_t:CDS:2 [Gigaspora margarita]|uniref:6960_t:CDS:1 n=1 Tax=Gigaspora margarita TaxID=4874 RepID=A0ABM8VX75_GIGMA|nr:6960_t:CDS:2 [Gigaspora margarita]
MSSILDSKQNQKRFHAAFLDGIRGIAALCVVFEHSQRTYKLSLPITTFYDSGYLGVRCFFVLSAFLLTFRSMLDWEQYHENIEDEKHIDNNARNRSAFESKIDLEADLTDVPLLSSEKLNEISTKTKYNIFYKFLSYNQLKTWIKHQMAIKIWLKFFLRRFMRIYPPYAILLPFIAYNSFLKRAYHQHVVPSTLASHLFLQKAEFTFWTILAEMKYYLCIPIIVIGYVELARFGAYITNYLFRRPNIGAWTCRILCNIILMIIRTNLLTSYKHYHDEYLQTNAHIFMAGTICSIWYREIIRLGLLPLSSKEEKDLTSKSNNFNNFDGILHTNLSFMKRIIKKLPSRYQLIRSFFDLGCYITLFMILCTFPHLSEKILGMPRIGFELVLENRVGGFLYAILILAGLLSRDGSFINACSCNFLRFCGRISFSIYLLHPIALTFVNEHLTWMGLNNAEDEFDKREKANNMFDAVIMSYFLTIILAWLYYNIVEKPSMNLANYIAKRWLNEVKLAKPDYKSVNHE